jgi:hypothetical protein
MKKVLVSHRDNKFEGCVELLYGEPGMGAEALPPLLVIDYKGVHLPDDWKVYFQKYVPVRFGPGFEEFAQGKLTFIYDDVEVDFYQDFYNPFGKKVNPKIVLEFWGKMSKVKQIKACNRLHAYLRYLSRKQWRSKCDPITYLKKEMYETDWDNLTD